MLPVVQTGGNLLQTCGSTHDVLATGGALPGGLVSFSGVCNYLFLVPPVNIWVPLAVLAECVAV